ncbi:hypothetical protein SLA2020_287610 [Shorea laevis]
MEEENVGDHDTCFESSSGGDYKKVEAFGLLDESWFFGNLFKRRTRMSRCYSDPCPSSKFSQSSSAATTKEGNGLARAPSLPPYLGRELEEVEKKKRNNGNIKMSHLTRQTSDGNLLKARTPVPNENSTVEIQKKRSDGKEKSRLTGKGKSSLLRTPSLPVSIGREELIDDENENDMRMSKLIWQAWSNSSENQPQRQTPKGVKHSPSTTPRNRPPRKTEAVNINAKAVQETRQRPVYQRTLKKSQSNLEFHDEQGFKDLRNYKEVVKQDKARRADLSKAWIVQSFAAQTPNCAAKTSTEDMKAQIKFWARAVATNVRQEC